MAAAQVIGEDLCERLEAELEPTPSDNLTRALRSPRAWSRHEAIDLEWYVGGGHDLVSRSPVGHQLECLRDNVRVTALPSSWPTWSRVDGARAQRIAQRLLRAEAICPGAIQVIWALCHPITVAMDGLPGGRARLVAIYGLTETGRRARWSAGGDKKTKACSLESRRIFALNGQVPAEALRSIYTNVAQAKGKMAALWAELDREAQELAERVSRAYVLAGEGERAPLTRVQARKARVESFMREFDL